MKRRTFLKATLAAVSVAVSGAFIGLRAAVAQVLVVRACLETTRGAAARDFGCGQGGEFRASPLRAVRNEPTPATDKRPAARRVFAEKAVWLRCSSVEDPPGIFSFVAPRHPAFSPKTAPLVVSKQALRCSLYDWALFISCRWRSSMRERRKNPARNRMTVAKAGLHQALHPLPARNEWGEDRGEGKPIKTHLLSPALSSIRWRRGRNPGA